LIATVLVGETRLNRADFLLATRQITGENYAREIDRHGRGSEIADDLCILDTFAGRPLADAVTHLSFLFAGPETEVDLLLDSAKGMAHLTGDIQKDFAKAVVISGSVFQWVTVVSECMEPRPVKQAFTEVYKTMSRMGLRSLFTVKVSSQTLMIERKK